ncbi:MAG: MBL fold metallo-hydrolase [Candidatus Omnitrophica bacterium]|nr:MBL fold metallo-hydrolase [Candidatus Omnitrophota bacterium]
MASELFIKQLLLGELENFTYIVADQASAEAMVIDPSGSWADISLALKENALELKGIFLTHGHYDHVVGVDKASVPVYLSEDEAEFYTPHAKNFVRNADREKFPIGRFMIECIHTPGHTPGCQCFLIEGNLFTGDTLFMDAVGRTDFPGGDAGVMFESLERIKRLPAKTEVWPGHHYGRLTHGSLAQVMKSNQFLACDDKNKFIDYFG